MCLLRGVRVFSVCTPWRACSQCVYSLECVFSVECVSSVCVLRGVRVLCVYSVECVFSVCALRGVRVLSVCTPWSVECDTTGELIVKRPLLCCDVLP